MIDIVHICYPGVGGQAAVATGLAVEGIRAGSRQAIVFYGVEQTAKQYIDLCDAEGIQHTTIVKRPGLGLGARNKLREAIKDYAPEIVIAHHHDTCITASFVFGRAKVIFVEHHSNALKSCKDWLMSTIAHRLSDHTVYLTSIYSRTVQEKVGRFHQQEKTSIIPNGLDLSLYQGPRNIRSNKITIGMQGRMDEGKDFAVLLDAFSWLQKKRPDLGVSLELVGDGPHRAELEKHTPENTSFSGFLSHDDLIERMRRWDIAVLATEGETLSMAVLEAWALGLPLVASRVPGVEDLVNDGKDGLLFETKFSTSLCEKLTLLIDDLSYGESIGNTARVRIEREYDRQAIWQQYQQLIRKLLQPIAQHVEPINLDPLD